MYMHPNCWHCHLIPWQNLLLPRAGVLKSSEAPRGRIQTWSVQLCWGQGKSYTGPSIQCLHSVAHPHELPHCLQPAASGPVPSQVSPASPCQHHSFPTSFLAGWAVAQPALPDPM